MLTNFLARTSLIYASFYMNEDLGIDSNLYRLGAGLFFVVWVSRCCRMTLAEP